MKPIQEVYPDAIDVKEPDYWWGAYNYQPLLESIGHEILLQVDDHDYQGDSRLILRDDLGRYGMLIFGWGSRSGCDSLQACKSYEEIDNLRNELVDSINWFGPKESAYRYFLIKDWEVEYSWHADETKEFIAKAIALLKL